MLHITQVSTRHNTYELKMRALVSQLKTASDLRSFKSNFEEGLSKMKRMSTARMDVTYQCRFVDEFTNNEALEIWHTGKTDRMVYRILDLK